MRARTSLVLSIASLALGGCTVPHRAAEVPLPTLADEAWIAVLSGAMPPPLEDVARHAWMYGRIPGRVGYTRWELGSGHHQTNSSPYTYFGDGDIAVHGIVRGDAAKIEALAKCLDRSTGSYYDRHPTYFPIPGPNSNTIIAEALRECGIHIELPATCIGRDYLGPVGAAVTENGTGVQLESWVAGVRVGLEDGVEAHVVSLPIGVHFWPPGITLPVNPAGRIGIDLDQHTTKPKPQPPSRRQRRERDVELAYVDDDDGGPRGPRDYGLGLAWLSLGGARVKRPSDAGGLAERFTAGVSGRGLYADRAGYAFGIDLELGAGVPLGFAYAIHVYPAGFGVTFGDTGLLAAFAGVGTSGVTARVPAALEIPFELRAEIDVTRHARLGLHGVTTFIPSDARRGASILPFGDELTVGTQVRFGSTDVTRGGRQVIGHGRFFSLERHEVMHTYWLGLTIGSELDFGG